MRTLWRSFFRLDGAMQAVIVSVAASVLLWLFVLAAGFQTEPAHAPTAYQPYFSIHNWWPYPFFFAALALPLWLTWEPMLAAWRKLAVTGVLKRGVNRADGEDADAVVEQIRSLRRGAVAAAAVIALLVGALDAGTFFKPYSGRAGAAEQAAFACEERNAFVKWLFDADLAGNPVDCDELVANDASGLPPPLPQILLILATSCQQWTIVLLAALGVCQLLLHTLLFGLFERLPVSRERGLRIELNATSRVSEFGLEHWNHALNNFYWAVSPAFVPAFFSRTATDPEHYLPGQELLGIAIPAALIAPMVATIIVRQLRLPVLWDALESGDLDSESYRRQALWPLDRNWASKLGILLSFVLAGLALGVNISRLVAL
jgi:hypothetical protein